MGQSQSVSRRSTAAKAASESGMGSSHPKSKIPTCSEKAKKPSEPQPVPKMKRERRRHWEGVAGADRELPESPIQSRASPPLQMQPLDPSRSESTPPQLPPPMVRSLPQCEDGDKFTIGSVTPDPKLLESSPPPEETQDTEQPGFQNMDAESVLACVQSRNAAQQTVAVEACSFRSTASSEKPQMTISLTKSVSQMPASLAFGATGVVSSTSLQDELSPSKTSVIQMPISPSKPAMAPTPPPNEQSSNQLSSSSTVPLGYALWTPSLSVAQDTGDMVSRAKSQGQTRQLRDRQREMLTFCRMNVPLGGETQKCKRAKPPSHTTKGFVAPKLERSPKKSSHLPNTECRSKGTGQSSANTVASPTATSKSKGTPAAKQALIPQKSQLSPVPSRRAKNQFLKPPMVAAGKHRQKNEDKWREQACPVSTTSSYKLAAASPKSKQTSTFPASPVISSKPKKKLGFKIPSEIKKSERNAVIRNKMGKEERNIPDLPASPLSPECPQQPGGGNPSFATEQGCSQKARSQHQTATELPGDVSRRQKEKKNPECQPPWVTTATLAASVALILNKDGANSQ